MSKIINKKSENLPSEKLSKMIWMLSSKYINNNIYINYFRSISRIVE